MAPTGLLVAMMFDDDYDVDSNNKYLRVIFIQIYHHTLTIICINLHSC